MVLELLAQRLGDAPFIALLSLFRPLRYFVGWSALFFLLFFRFLRGRVRCSIFGLVLDYLGVNDFRIGDGLSLRFGGSLVGIGSGFVGVFIGGGRTGCRAGRTPGHEGEASSNGAANDGHPQGGEACGSPQLRAGRAVVAKVTADEVAGNQHDYCGSHRSY